MLDPGPHEDEGPSKGPTRQPETTEKQGELPPEDDAKEDGVSAAMIDDALDLCGITRMRRTEESVVVVACEDANRALEFTYGEVDGDLAVVGIAETGQIRFLRDCLNVYLALVDPEGEASP